MVILLTGASHTGKTLLAQRILETYGYPYLSIDHLKMGLIRSGSTSLKVDEDDALTSYLWTILKEMMKTAIENQQNLVIEGCYIPFDWKESFSEEYLQEIRYCCLVMSSAYIQNNFHLIQSYGNVIEQRLDTAVELQEMLEENAKYENFCKQYQLPYQYIEDTYDVSVTFVNDL